MRTLSIIIDQKNSFVAGAFRRLGAVRVLPTHEISARSLRDADAVVVRSETKVDAALLEGTCVRFVGTATIGTDHIDVEHLHAKAIGFASAPGSNAESVAQYLAAGILVIAERLGMQLQGRTIGVIGVGNVGSRVARVAGALGMRVLKNDPPLARSTADPSFLPLDALMEADIVSLHVPLTETGDDPTYHLFDALRLSALKRGTVLINTSRGAVVDGRGLLESLRGGRLAGAIVDTWEHEPAIDVRLLESVTLGTPHIAGYSLDGKLNAARMIFEAMATYFGIDRHWEFGDALPGPRVPDIGVSTLGDNLQNALRAATTSCYDIEGDDAALREIVRLPEKERAARFRKLRATYPVRREFSATRVTGADIRPDLAARLAGCGFTIG